MEYTSLGWKAHYKTFWISHTVKSLHTDLSSQRVSDVQGEIVSELSCKDQAEDRNR